jgi:hypothetical protein
MSKLTAVRCSVALVAALGVLEASAQFPLQEATIDSLHAAIRSGETTCKQVIEGYIARAKAYNGVCTVPVTADGAKISRVQGAVRAGAPVTFPTETVALTSIVPDFDKYTGYKPDYGRMEPIASIRACSSSTAWSSAGRARAS